MLLFLSCKIPIHTLFKYILMFPESIEVSQLFKFLYTFNYNFLSADLITRVFP